MNDSAEAIRMIIGEPFEWCDVPAGEFLYGTKKETVTLPSFAIARYPITYSQFQSFVDDGGFEGDRWWDGLAHRPDDPGEQEWKINDHPRENASWYDALAFSRWLSWKLNGVYDISKIGQWAVRLPTEFEWEKAARGTDGREYPWGNDFDESKCNTDESGIGKTTPVTKYVQGVSPYGVYDMAGNVWEWCLSDDKVPQLDAGDENIRIASARVWRGGSWSLSQGNARATVRIDLHPYRRLNLIGFRLVTNPSL